MLPKKKKFLNEEDRINEIVRMMESKKAPSVDEEYPDEEEEDPMEAMEDEDSEIHEKPSLFGKKNKHALNIIIALGKGRHD